METQNADKLYTVKDLMEYFKVGNRPILKLLSSGKLKGFKIATKWYVTKKDLDEFIENQKTQK